MRLIESKVLGCETISEWLTILKEPAFGKLDASAERVVEPPKRRSAPCALLCVDPQRPRGADPTSIFRTVSHWRARGCQGGVPAQIWAVTDSAPPPRARDLEETPSPSSDLSVSYVLTYARGVPPTRIPLSTIRFVVAKKSTSILLRLML